MNEIIMRTPQDPKLPAIPTIDIVEHVPTAIGRLLDADHLSKLLAAAVSATCTNDESEPLIQKVFELVELALSTTEDCDVCEIRMTLKKLISDIDMLPEPNYDVKVTLNPLIDDNPLWLLAAYSYFHDCRSQLGADRADDITLTLLNATKAHGLIYADFGSSNEKDIEISSYLIEVLSEEILTLITRIGIAVSDPDDETNNIFLAGYYGKRWKETWKNIVTEAINSASDNDFGNPDDPDNPDE